MTNTTDIDTQATISEDTVDALVRVMRVGVDRAYNARTIIAAIQRGEVPGIAPTQ